MVKSRKRKLLKVTQLTKVVVYHGEGLSPTGLPRLVYKKIQYTLTNQRIVTPPWQLWNALTIKRAGLVWTFFNRTMVKVRLSLSKKSPHKSSLFRHESITKLPGWCHYSWVVRVYIFFKATVKLQPSSGPINYHALQPRASSMNRNEIEVKYLTLS